LTCRSAPSNAWSPVPLGGSPGKGNGEAENTELRKNKYIPKIRTGRLEGIIQIQYLSIIINEVEKEIIPDYKSTIHLSLRA
jgi:hypothetical protein